MKHPAAVVIPSDRPATLGIARSLGRRGIPIYGVDVDPKAYGMASKYLNACPLPRGDDSEENRLRFLVDLGKKLGDKAVLFPLRDDDVLLCSRERKELQISSVSAGALSTYTLIGMGVGGVLAGWLADRIGRVRVVWWWLAASSYSIGLGIGLLGISYAVCALVPGLFIREKMFDPRAIEPPAAAARLEPAGLDATP